MWVIVGLIFGQVELLSQLQPLLDQHYLNGLAINPAYSGSQEALNAGVFYRAQWWGFKGAIRTTTLSAHAPIRNKKTKVCLIVMSDRQKSLHETGFLLNVFSHRYF